MKVIQALGWYFPDSSGGTEVYVDTMSRELRRFGIESFVAAPRCGTGNSNYEFKGTQVFRYSVSPPYDRDQLRFRTRHTGFNEFKTWLARQSAPIYHQHSLTTGCGIFHLEEARRQGKKTVTTLHLPDMCVRGTMLQNGKDVCNGLIDARKCATCRSESKGISPWASALVSLVPQRLSEKADLLWRDNRVNTMIATRSLVDSHRSRFERMVDLSDRIIAVCQWMYDSLRLNNVPEEKIILCRQGVGTKGIPSQNTMRILDQTVEELRIGYIGRWAAVKGVDILVKAINLLPKSIPISLTIHALQADVSEQGFQARVENEAAADPRIRIAPPLAREDVHAAMRGFDLLVVPSQWLETGPLVVLEALNAGTPVLGSNLGGIAELITDGFNGWLVDAQDTVAWRNALLRIAADRTSLSAVKSNIQPVREMRSVAIEMAAVYSDLVHR